MPSPACSEPAALQLLSLSASVGVAGNAVRKLGSFCFICPPGIWWLRLNACVYFLGLLLKNTVWQVGVTMGEAYIALGERFLLLGRASSGPVLLEMW